MKIPNKVPVTRKTVFLSSLLVYGVALLIGFQNCSAPVRFAEQQDSVTGGSSVVIPGGSPENCGSHNHGTSWWENSGSIDENINCPSGSNVTNEYHKEVEYTCDNGDVSETGNSRRGDLIQGGQCPQTAPCGSHPHGTTWSSVIPNQEVTEIVNCQAPLQGSLTNYYQKKQNYRCDNGQSMPTTTVRGSLNRTTGQCILPPQNCGSVTHGQTQTVVDGTIVEKPACPTGQTGEIKNTYQKLVAKVCNNGALTAVGQPIKGNLISSSNTCAVPPANCGSRPHSTTWWEPSDDTLVTPKTCPYGGSASTVKVKEYQYKCDNGTISQTGASRAGANLPDIGMCNPPPAACGTHPHGSNWWEDSNELITEPGDCPYGGNLQNKYKKAYQKICTNGSISDTGQTKKGTLASQTGACNAPPASCGDHPHGDEWWESYNPIKKIKINQYCQYGGNLKFVYDKERERKCNNGAISDTGDTQQGAQLPDEGMCCSQGQSWNGNACITPTPTPAPTPVATPPPIDTSKDYRVTCTTVTGGTATFTGKPKTSQNGKLVFSGKPNSSCWSGGNYLNTVVVVVSASGSGISVDINQSKNCISFYEARYCMYGETVNLGSYLPGYNSNSCAPVSFNSSNNSCRSDDISGYGLCQEFHGQAGSEAMARRLTSCSITPL